MLVSKNAKICVTPNANTKICVTPNTNPQCKPVEYSSCWVRQSWVCVGHVLGMFVLFLVASGTKRKRNIQWNTGLIVIHELHVRNERHGVFMFAQ